MNIFDFLKNIYHLEFNLARLKINSIIKSRRTIPSFSSGSGQERKNSDILPTTQQDINCQLKCWNYINLEEDYRNLYEENQKFRVWLNLGEFKPQNEKNHD